MGTIFRIPSVSVRIAPKTKVLWIKQKLICLWAIPPTKLKFFRVAHRVPTSTKPKFFKELPTKSQYSTPPRTARAANSWAGWFHSPSMPMAPIFVCLKAATSWALTPPATLLLATTTPFRPNTSRYFIAWVCSNLKTNFRPTAPLSTRSLKKKVTLWMAIPLKWATPCSVSAPFNCYKQYKFNNHEKTTFIHCVAGHVHLGFSTKIKHHKC